ncbi:hypothetical protein BGW80DRAFT_1365215 [Lactifluus volemus]|nr:hypothetical protein BGW80DRAFT_1365215 [Lactifluus volemus]
MHLLSTLCSLMLHLISPHLLLLHPSQVYSRYMSDVETTSNTVKTSSIGRHISWASTSFSDSRTGSSLQPGPKSEHGTVRIAPRDRSARHTRARCP